MRLTTKTICGLVAALLLVPAAASAKTHVAVGLGDQHASTFSAPAFRALHVKKARYFIRWDAAKVPSALAAGDDYVREARAAGVRVLMHISTNNFAHGRAKLPSTRSYRKWVGRLVRHYKAMGVREFGVWNEENHVSQPTYKNPRRAAARATSRAGSALCRARTATAGSTSASTTPPTRTACGRAARPRSSARPATTTAMPGSG